MPNESARRPDILEKHIDEVIARRLKSDPIFAREFVDSIFLKLGASVPYQGLTVDRQVRHEGTTGTIDLLIRLFVDGSGETGRILIENKLDSSFTPNQPERYASSAIAMSRSGRPAFPIICAPSEYIAKSKYLDQFKSHTTYQEIASWLDGVDLAALEQAILRFSMPYEPDPVPEVQNFFEGYSQLAREIAPELIVKPNPNARGERPERSRTIYFVVRKTLPIFEFLPTLRFSHQCWDSSAPSASVKVMFDGWAAYESHLCRIASDTLGNTPLYLRKSGRSLGLVHDTPRMDNKRSVSTQRSAVVKGIRAAAILRAWVHAKKKIFLHWASVAAQEPP